MSSRTDSEKESLHWDKHYPLVIFLAVGLLVISSLAPIGVPTSKEMSVLWNHMPSVLYPLTALLAAAMFHLFSTGNAVYSAGIHYDSPRLFQFGNRISATAMAVGLSTGTMLTSAVLFTISKELDMSRLGYVGFFLQTTSLTLFAIAICNHRPDHKWFTYIKQAMENSSWGTGSWDIEDVIDNKNQSEGSKINIFWELTRSLAIALFITFLVVSVRRLLWGVTPPVACG